MPKLTILPTQSTIDFNSEENILSVLKKNNIYVKNTCGGCASCTHCMIKVVGDDTGANEPSFEEKQILGNVYHITKERLSCQLKSTNDLTIDISAHMDKSDKKSGQKTKLRKKSELDKIAENKEPKERKKRLGGGRKPKAFNFTPEE